MSIIIFWIQEAFFIRIQNFNYWRIGRYEMIPCVPVFFLPNLRRALKNYLFPVISSINPTLTILLKYSFINIKTYKARLIYYGRKGKFSQFKKLFSTVPFVAWITNSAFIINCPFLRPFERDEKLESETLVNRIERLAAGTFRIQETVGC